MKTLTPKKIAGSLLAFILFWSVITNAWGYSEVIFGAFEHGQILYGILSRILWLIPAIILIFIYRDNFYIKPEMFAKTLPHSKAFIIISILSVLYWFVYSLISHRGFWFNTEAPILFTVILFIFVAVVEETVFRFWGYNALSTVISDHSAAIISTVLFVVLHWPAYFIRFYKSGSFDFLGIVSQSIVVLIWGFICCYLLKKDKSIWSPIIAHFLFDLAGTFFAGI